MAKFYGMNGSKGRAKTLAGIRRERKAEAAAAGIDVSDRKALGEWDRKRFADLCKRLSGEATHG